MDPEMRVTAFIKRNPFLFEHQHEPLTINNLDFELDDLDEKAIQPLLYQRPFVLRVGVPVNHLVGETFAAPADIIADARRANANTGGAGGSRHKLFINSTAATIKEPGRFAKAPLLINVNPYH